MAYSTDQAIGNSLDSFNASQDASTARKRSAIQFDQGQEEIKHVKSRRAIDEGRRDDAYDYAKSERDRTDRLRKYRSSMAKFTQTKGEDFKGLLEAFDDPNDDVDYDNIAVNEDGSITMSGKGQEPITVPTLDDFVKFTNAEFDSDTWHKNRAAEASAKSATAGKKADQADKLALEDRKGEWRVTLEKEKVKAKGMTKVPADLQVTQALFGRMAKLYPKVNPDKLWIAAYQEATKVGDSPKQVRAAFMKSFITGSTDKYSSPEDVERISKIADQLADEIIDKSFGSLDELGMAVPEAEPEPEKPQVPMMGGETSAIKPNEEAPAAPVSPEERNKVIAMAKEKFPDPMALNRHLMKKFPERDVRIIQEQVKMVFPAWSPQVGGPAAINQPQP